MITLDKARKDYPEAFKGLSEEDSEKVLTDLHILADIAFDMWLKDKKTGHSPMKD